MTGTANGAAPNTSRVLAMAAAVAITIAGGVVYGKYSQRWGPPADLSAAGAKLEKLPKSMGPWLLAEELPLEKSAQEMLECAGYANGRYVNRETGEAVSMAVIVGPPGPMSVHTPEICFSSRAYQQQGSRQRVALDSTPLAPQSFWTLDFGTQNVLADGLRVYYAWSRGKNWEASESPRYEFAAAPMLYKIQLAAPLSATLGKSNRDVGKEFLMEFLRSGWPLVQP